MDHSAFIQNALQEDIGAGDHTSLACVPASAQGKARLLVKEAGILAGVELAKEIFHIVDPKLEMEVVIPDGSKVSVGDEAFYVSGSSQSILTGERLVLNCMQRMSGIATKTARFVKELDGLHAQVIDTRKTTPGIRALEKWAVRIGGGANHRMGLYDMVMIKDNHIDFCGGIPEAIQKVNAYLKDNNLDIRIEIESRNIEDVKKILEIGQVHRIMLDNYTPADCKAAVELIDGRYETEASGGINLKTIRGYGETGVDFISVGALTHSAVSMDLSLKAL